MHKEIKDTQIERFHTIYHRMVKQSLTESSYPNELKPLGTIDISVINLIATAPGIIVKEIAGKLNIPNSTLTSSLNRLEKQGLANRVISPRDRRSFGLELTEKGWKIQNIHLNFETSYFESILKKLDGDEERDTFLHLLDKIYR